MKTYLLIKGVLLGVILLSFPLTNAQVTIGIGEAPLEGSILQLKTIEDDTSAGNVNATRGLGLPRVDLSDRNELYPMYLTDPQDPSSGPTAEYLADKAKIDKRHIGLTVYNIGSAFREGLYYWDGIRWEMTEKAPEKAEVSGVDCSRATVWGEYYKGTGLNSTHYIQLPVHFSAQGNYNLSIRTGNGYYFYKNGSVEAPGTYTLLFEGLGVPSIEQVDQLRVYLNDELLDITCLPTITIQSTVINYYVNCGNLKVVGDYYVGEGVDENHYVEIPIVFDNYTPDAVTIRSNIENGLYFDFDEPVPQPADISDPVIIRLVAQGIPNKAGLFQYQFKTNGGNIITCNFEVKVDSKLGTFTYPAKCCLAILNENPTAADGEYWIMKDATIDDDTPIKTFCDMTGGGYTLIWSYSEKTAYTGSGIYGSSNTMPMTKDHQLNLDLPENVVENDETKTIDYKNYRLSKTTMTSVKGSTLGKYRVQVAYDPTNMKDAWAKVMYMKVEALRIARDFINGGGNNLDLATFKIEGKLYNIAIKADGKNLTFDGRVTRGSPGAYNGSYYATHFNFNYSFGVRDPTQYRWTVNLPKHPDDGGETYSYEFDSRGFNNMFGWYGEKGGDHHFGKCKKSSSVLGDDYTINDTSDEGCSGSDKTPHSFNNGEGRYLQWWVR